ncbi:MAG TPA: hypothetical protein V6D15_18870 [Oculatellaceae cyanobacterium]|jgi:hypothetical protein
MKLRLLAIVFGLIIPVTACNSSKQANAPTPAQSPTSTSSSVSNVPASPAASPKTAASSDTSAVSKNWYNYSSTDGKYSAKFPDKPNEQKRASKAQQGEISGTEVRYIDNANQRLYLTGHVNLPAPKGAKLTNVNVDKILDGGRDSMAKTVGATVKNETKISQGEYPGREFLMTLPNGLSAKARIFINPKNLKAYQAVFAAKDGKVDAPDAKAFLDSVKLK